ncbi:PTB-containing, cubilin and LRP1-interacting protein isoform X1 [Hypomesus transpacificus]|uniref:PTB-containing, cubilin and LRP1-interacting protein isoform X1 n=1 Tax=Hypomesus transpacificus TaxID=137520 RepID=UPI001F084DF8|nr:PTB-containing, cubilin and LRP1-interacting protein isoform X1 [Hypomesus transpacificus]
MWQPATERLQHFQTMLKTKLNVLTLRKEPLPTVIFHEPEAIELCSTTPLMKNRTHAGYKVQNHTCSTIQSTRYRTTHAVPSRVPGTEPHMQYHPEYQVQNHAVPSRVHPVEGDLPGQGDHLWDPVLVGLHRTGRGGPVGLPGPLHRGPPPCRLPPGDPPFPGTAPPPGWPRRGLHHHGYLPGGANRLLHRRPQREPQRVCLDLPGDQRRPDLPDGLPRRGVREQAGGQEAGPFHDGGIPQDLPQHAQRRPHPQEQLLRRVCRGLHPG